MATGFDFAYGERILVRLPLDNTSADIEVGDAITPTDADPGFYKEVDASGEATVGIAVEKVTSPTVDGGATVLVNISEAAYYRVNPTSGTVSSSLRFKLADMGADSRSVNTGASLVDNVKIHDYRTDDNSLLVSIIVNAYTGV